MLQNLTLPDLLIAAKLFCLSMSQIAHPELYGITDGKAVGTFIEQGFRKQLLENFILDVGNSARGIDLPSIQTDIKATSVRQPQSSCPFQSSRQKVYGLGYNLLLFVYDKADDPTTKTAQIKFVSCSFIDKSRTADYQTTRGLHDILSREGNKDDIVAFLEDRNLPGDEIMLNSLADEILSNPPLQGYLTISNALQWRLQYGRVVALTQIIIGIERII